MTKTLKTSNAHKPHPTACATCGRVLPKRAYKPDCAGCIRQRQGQQPSHWLWTLSPAERTETVRAANEHRAAVGLPLIGRRARRDLARALPAPAAVVA